MQSIVMVLENSVQIKFYFEEEASSVLDRVGCCILVFPKLNCIYVKKRNR